MTERPDAAPPKDRCENRSIAGVVAGQQCGLESGHHGQCFWTGEFSVKEMEAHERPDAAPPKEPLESMLKQDKVIEIDENGKVHLPTDAAPVAWRWRGKAGLAWKFTSIEPSLVDDLMEIQPLYAHPEDAPGGPETQPKRETGSCDRCGGGGYLTVASPRCPDCNQGTEAQPDRRLAKAARYLLVHADDAEINEDARENLRHILAVVDVALPMRCDARLKADNSQCALVAGHKDEHIFEDTTPLRPDAAPPKEPCLSCGSVKWKWLDLSTPKPPSCSDCAPPPSDAAPVAWRWRRKLTTSKGWSLWVYEDLKPVTLPTKDDYEVQPLYAHPEDAPLCANCNHNMKNDTATFCASCWNEAVAAAEDAPRGPWRADPRGIGIDDDGCEYESPWWCVTNPDRPQNCLTEPEAIAVRDALNRVDET